MHALPTVVSISTSVSSFKTNLKTHLTFIFKNTLLLYPDISSSTKPGYSTVCVEGVEHGLGGGGACVHRGKAGGMLFNTIFCSALCKHD